MLGNPTSTPTSGRPRTPKTTTKAPEPQADPVLQLQRRGELPQASARVGHRGLPQHLHDHVVGAGVIAEQPVRPLAMILLMLINDTALMIVAAAVVLWPGTS